MQAETTLSIGSASSPSPLQRALDDVTEGVKAYHVWGKLGWQDIKQRYRRSVLGPFWITLTTAILVTMIGFVYSGLFKQPMQVYFPFISISMVTWGLMSSLLNEACTTFISSEQIMKQVRLPLTLHVCRMVWRNLLVFLHNAVIFVVIYIIFWKGWHWQLLMLPVALLAILANGLWIGLLLGALCARFRDIPQIVTNLIQVVFFATPIMWLPSGLKGHSLEWLITINPANHFLEIVRAPLLGSPFPELSWIVVGAFTAVGWALAMYTLVRIRHRVPYWL